MNKKTYLISLLLCLAAFTNAQERVVERPPFISWTTQTIEVDKIVLSDTATVMKIKAFFRPKNWIQIAKGCFLRDNNGKEYPLRSSIGITPGTNFWMPDSGEAEFALVFPPLSKTATSVDFTEGDGVEGAFKLFGIQLTGTRLPEFTLPKGVVAHPIDKKSSLPEPKLQYGNAVLKGRILDYTPELGGELSLYLFDPLGSWDPTSIKLNKDGSFRLEVKAFTVVPAMLQAFNNQIKCLLAPGEETELILNLREYTRKQTRLHKDDAPYGEAVYFNGYLPSLQQELNSGKEVPIERYSLQFFNDINGMTLDQYKEYVMAKRKSALALIKESPVSNAFKEIQEINWNIQTLGLIESARFNLPQAHCVVNKLNREEGAAYMRSASVEYPADYYDVVKELPINSSRAIYAELFKEGVMTAKNIEMKDASLLGKREGVLFDMMSAISIARSMDDFEPLDSESDSLVSTLPVAYQDFIRAKNAELLAKVEVNKKKTGYTIKQGDDVPNEELFASIISQYKDKVLLIDFWATWCGPCRMANKEMIPMKEELKDKGIVYVYLAGQNSPQGTWENMIPDIHGEHYRLSDSQWDYLSKHFSIQGVPTYIIVDRTGNITLKQTGYPGTDKMKTELLKAVDK